MTQLRAYIFLGNVDSADVTVHRDTASIDQAWSSRTTADSGALVHIGFTRPSVEECIPLLIKHAGRVLLSASAKYSYGNNVNTTSSPVATIDDLPIYMCTSGFGYECDESTIEQLEKSKSHQQSRPNVYERSDRWLNQFMEDSSISDELITAGINSDTTYLQFESSLSTQLRLKLAKARFRVLVGDAPTAENLLGNLKYAPPWMLNLRIVSLALPVRAINALTSHSIRSFEDLCKFTEIEIRGFPNLGKKTYNDISIFALKLFETGPEHPAVLNGSLDAQVDYYAEDLVLPAEVIESKRSFSHAWSSAMDSLRDVEVSVITKRAGVDEAPMTLQEISDFLGVTRERVRQIEAKASAKMAAQVAWNTDLGDRLERILANRTEGLHFEGLEVFDPWFHRISLDRSPFEFALDHFLNNRFHLVRVGGQLFVSHISQKNWDIALREAKNIITANLSDRPTLEHLKFLVESLISGEADELREELWLEAANYAHFSLIDGQKRLVSYGSSVEQKVLKVLEESNSPLHYSEVHRKLLASGVECELSRCRTALPNVAVLFARGTYGVSRHLNFTPEEKVTILDETLDHVLSQDPERQWHCTELVESILSRHYEFENRLDKFTLTQILKDCNELVYLGRMVWALKSSGVTGTSNRIDRLQATIAIIRDAGVPLTHKQIRDRISAERGLGNYFQIFPDGPLVKIDSSHWGLLERDVPLSSAQIDEIQVQISHILKERQKAIHLSEIQTIVSSFMPEAAKLNPSCLFSIVSRSDEFSLTSTDYLYLTIWGGPKRASFTEACYKVLRDADGAGITKVDGVLKVVEILGRPLNHVENLSFFSRIDDAVFDPVSKLWKLEEDVES